MPSHRTTNKGQGFRHRIQAIRLDPETSKHDISAEIQVDGKKVRKLPRIEKGQKLEWKDLYLACDVNDGSTITINVIESHTLKDRIGSAVYKALQAMNQETISTAFSEGGKDMFKVHTVIMDEDAAYLEALAKSKRGQKYGELTEKSSKAEKAFMKILALSSMLCDLEPTGTAKVALSVCISAWERFEAQEKQNTIVDDLIEDLARTMSTVESIRSIADKNLSETVIEMMKLVEDVSALVLNEGTRSRPGTMLLTWALVQERAEVLAKRCKRLRKELQERIAAQSLNANEIHRIRESLKELNPARFAGYNPTRQCLEGTRVSLIDALIAWVEKGSDRARVAWVNGLAGLGKSSVATSVCKRLDDQRMLACSFFCKRDSSELRDPCRLLMTVVCELAQRWPTYGAIVSKTICKNIGIHSKHIQPLYEILVVEPLKTIAETEHLVGTLVVVIDALDECGDVETRRQLLICVQDISERIPSLRVIITSRPDEDIRAYFHHTASEWYSEFNLLQYDATEDIRRFVSRQLGPYASAKGWPPDSIDQVTTRANGLFIWAGTACAYILSGLDKPRRLKIVTQGSSLAAIDGLYETILTSKETVADEEDMKDMRSCLGVIVATSMHGTLSVTELSVLMGEHITQEVLQGVIDRLASVLYIDDKLGGAIRISHPSFMDYITDSTRSKELCIDLREQNAILARRSLDAMASGLRFNICGLETSGRLNRDVPDLEARVQAAISPSLAYACKYWASHLAKSYDITLEMPLRSFICGAEIVYWLEALSLLGMLSVAPASMLQVERWCASERMKDCLAMAKDAYRFVLTFYDPISTSTPHLYISALPMAPSNSLISKRTQSSFPNRFIASNVLGAEWTHCIRSISVGSAVRSVAVSPDGEYIASGDDNGTIRVWDTKTGEAVLAPLRGHSGSVKSVVFSYDGQHVVSGSSDHEIRVWNAGTGESVVGPLRGHSGCVNSVTCSHQDALIASGSDDDTVRFWSINTGETLFEAPLGFTRGVLHVKFSPDDRLVASGSGDGTVRLWDVRQRSMIFEPLATEVGYMLSLAFSSDGQQLISMSFYRNIYIFSVTTGELTTKPLAGPLPICQAATSSPDGNYIALGLVPNHVVIWKVYSSTAVLGPLVGHSDSIESIDFSPDGNCVVSGSVDTTIRIWDVSSIPITKPAPLHLASGTDASDQPTLQTNFALALSSDCRLIASNSNDDKVWLWGIETGQIVLGPLMASDSFRGFAFSPDSSFLAAGSVSGAVYIWELKSGSLVHGPLQGHLGAVRSLAFSPDGQHLVTGSWDNTLRIWDVATGGTVADPFVGHTSPVHAVAFSPDCRHVASGSHDNTVRVWDARTGHTFLGPLNQHSSRVLSVAYSPDGLQIASSSNDGTICTWDAQTGNLLLVIQEPDSCVPNSITYSHGHQYIVSGLNNGRLHVRNSVTGHMICERLLNNGELMETIAVSRDDSRIVSIDFDAIRVSDSTSYLKSNSPSRHVPGTNIFALSGDSGGERLMVAIGQLARHLDSSLDGWVTDLDGKLLMWLPHELRRIDDSYMRIDMEGFRRPVIDFTKFVYGKDWALVKGG
ncbi:hypothetical protein RhiJN_24524 [Ceratobasidium sp. AG-Ba]|nr:hypothetical protein RhiJN_24524 [Ceratobasidium sp. AG-Ba]